MKTSEWFQITIEVFRLAILAKILQTMERTYFTRST